MPDPAFDPAEAWRSVTLAIDTAAREAGRDLNDVALTAVCKQQPWARVAPVLAAGQRAFGENRVQEAAERWRDRRDGVELRLIGPLQTNKTREAVRLFDVIETLDRPRLARALAEEFATAGASPRLLVQINTGEEPQKSGVAPAVADAFIAACRIEFGLPVEGLMCIPPLDEPAGPHFALLRKIAERNGLRELSMGMSADFALAIRFGATRVRIGEAVFGPRPPRHP
ncbi:MAG TPA: YggS family pyridoxal phosphate-dependent enzyme [Caulobacteraceae bacterium]|nr:YggS family pyridoxal phosphate-dependent enzyme [Caulobacteraceae bacterium]